MLTYLVSQGAIERRAHGLYCFPDYSGDLDLSGILNELLQIIPDAIVGLETALQLYDLSDEPTKTIHLIVSQNKAPTRKLPDVHFFRVRRPLSEFNTQKIKGTRVTTIEQTLVDLLRAGHSISEMVRIFQGAQRRRIVVDLSVLKKLGERFHVKGKVERVIEAVC
jgi:predicted transcriptional regulator of viral defense system